MTTIRTKPRILNPGCCFGSPAYARVSWQRLRPPVVVRRRQALTKPDHVNFFAHVYVCISMHSMYTYVYRCTYTYIHMYARIKILRRWTLLCLSIHKWSHTCICLYVCMHVCMYVCILYFIYLYIWGCCPKFLVPEWPTSREQKSFRETFAEPSPCMILITGSFSKRKRKRERERERERERKRQTDSKSERVRERERGGVRKRETERE